MEISVCTVVWGQPYVSFFLDVVLPTYLAPRNLPILQNEWKISFMIATNGDGVEQIRSHALYKELVEYGEIIFEQFDKKYFTTNVSITDEKYQLMYVMHSHLIKQCIERQSVAINASPDIIICDNSLENAFKYINIEKKIVIAPCALRVNKEEVLEKLLKLKVTAKCTNIPLTIDHIGNFISDNLHNISKSQFLNSEPRNCWKSNQFISHKNLIIARSAHMHPFLIDCRGAKLERNIAKIPLDGGVKDSFNMKANQIYTITDSKIFGAVEVSSRQINVTHPILPASNIFIESLKLVKWQKNNLDYPSYSNYFRYLFYYYANTSNVSINTIIFLKIKLFWFNFPSSIYFTVCATPYYYVCKIIKFIRYAFRLEKPRKAEKSHCGTA